MSVDYISPVKVQGDCGQPSEGDHSSQIKAGKYGPIKGVFDKVEAARLKALISNVYGCHGNVCKELAEAECSGELLNAKRKRRENLYRRCEAFNISQEKRDNVCMHVYYICVYKYFLVLCIYVLCLKLHKNSFAMNYIHMYIYTYVYNCLNLH